MSAPCEWLAPLQQISSEVSLQPWATIPLSGAGAAMDPYMTYGGDSMMSDQSYGSDQLHASTSMVHGAGGDQFFEMPDWQVRLDFEWFPPLIQQKLLDQAPFIQSDWSVFMNVIFDHFFSLDCTQPRNPRQWYTDMTALIVEKYPHLFGPMTIPQRLAFMRNKLIHKFKNGRFKVQVSMRPKGPKQM